MFDFQIAPSGEHFASSCSKVSKALDLIVVNPKSPTPLPPSSTTPLAPYPFSQAP